MNCMKCGKETDENQIFCEDCLAVMEKYPVKPGVVVQIPVQPAKKQVHHHRRPTLTAEERVRRLARWNLVLSGLLLLAISAALVFASMTFDLFQEENVKKLLGQNYSVVQQTEPLRHPIVTIPQK